jgi:hypothetical protein
MVLTVIQEDGTRFQSAISKGLDLTERAFLIQETNLDGIICSLIHFYRNENNQNLALYYVEEDLDTIVASTSANTITDVFADIDISKFDAVEYATPKRNLLNMQKVEKFVTVDYKGSPATLLYAYPAAAINTPREIITLTEIAENLLALC